MFRVKTQHEDTALEDEIRSLYDNMIHVDRGSDDYTKMVNQLTKLYALRSSNASKRVSPDTMAIVLGNLAGILLIVGHEKAHVVTSKALGFVMKAR